MNFAKNQVVFVAGIGKLPKEAFAKQKCLDSMEQKQGRFSEIKNQPRLFCFFFGRCKKEKPSIHFFACPKKRIKEKTLSPQEFLRCKTDVETPPSRQFVGTSTTGAFSIYSSEKERYLFQSF